ncbi:MAG TPA: hypothetical protein EYO84_04895, partial [Planctomycetes bacterium]|nr:hypothetical protein [Planctomycetota bacterium]
MTIQKLISWTFPLVLLLVPCTFGAAQEQGGEKKAVKKQVISVYDVEADASADIAAAVASAHKNNKRVLVVYGGNWCGWCV